MQCVSVFGDSGPFATRNAACRGVASDALTTLLTDLEANQSPDSAAGLPVTAPVSSDRVSVYRCDPPRPGAPETSTVPALASAVSVHHARARKGCSPRAGVCSLRTEPQSEPCNGTVNSLVAASTVPLKSFGTPSVRLQASRKDMLTKHQVALAPAGQTPSPRHRRSGSTAKSL